MCEYGYEFISRSTVCIRKPRRCDSCARRQAIGTAMVRHVGKTEGDFGVSYGCAACQFAHAQPDGSPLHICWGDLHEGDGPDDTAEIHAYIRHCLDNGEAPTVTGLEGALAQHRELAAIDDGPSAF